MYSRLHAMTICRNVEAQNRRGPAAISACSASLVALELFLARNELGLDARFRLRRCFEHLALPQSTPGSRAPLAHPGDAAVDWIGGASHERGFVGAKVEGQGGDLV